MSDQASMFPTDDRKPWQRSARELARRTDPATSHEAAASLGQNAETLRRRLLEPFRRAELTAEEAARRTGVDPWQASKRVSDLANAGFLEPTGEYRSGSHGRRQRVLSITEAGRKALGGLVG